MPLKAALQRFAAAERPRIEAALERAVARLAGPVGAAAAYSIRAGGKRIRPLLVVASHGAAGGEERQGATPEGPAAIYDVAAAVELIHTYSLLHDDLPSMDDDAMRRGLPTAHRVYGADVAASAGFALQQLAFLTLARSAEDPRIAPALPGMIQRLARGAGVEGMVAGQYLDLEAEGRAVDGPGLEAIHRAKTAALIASACALGGMAADADDAAIAALTDYGTHLGLAFQIVDDLLDEIGDPARMGKAAGADRRRAKATYPTVYGIERARALAGRIVAEAGERVGRLPGDTSLLIGFGEFVLERLD